MIKLFVIDDHYLILEGVCSSFDLASDEFAVVGASLSVDEAITMIDPGKTDIILLDLFIKFTDPVCNLSKIQRTFPTIPVVILSNERSLTWKLEMFHRGVKAYMGKSEDKQSMSQKLLQVYKGNVVIPDEVVKIILASESLQVDIQNHTDVRMIIEDLSRGLSVKEIAINKNQSESAIEKKLHNCRKAYNVKTNIELVYKALVNRYVE